MLEVKQCCVISLREAIDELTLHCMFGSSSPTDPNLVLPSAGVQWDAPQSSVIPYPTIKKRKKTRKNSHANVKIVCIISSRDQLTDNILILLDVLVFSIAEYFTTCAVF